MTPSSGEGRGSTAEITTTPPIIEPGPVMELPARKVNWANEIAAYSLMTGVELWVILIRRPWDWNNPLNRFLVFLALAASATTLIAGPVGLVVARRRREAGPPRSGRSYDLPVGDSSWQSPDGRWWSAASPPTRITEESWAAPDGASFARVDHPFFLQRQSRGTSWALAGSLVATWFAALILVVIVGLSSMFSTDPNAESASRVGVVVVAAVLFSAFVVRRAWKVPHEHRRIRSSPHPWPGTGSATGARWHQRGSKVALVRNVVAVIWAVTLVTWFLPGRLSGSQTPATPTFTIPGSHQPASGQGPCEDGTVPAAARRIAFVVACPALPGDYQVEQVELIVATSDGSRFATVDRGPYAVYWPAWSPDGSRIAYVAGGLVVVRADGSNPRYLTSTGRMPSWSPDGQEVAYLLDFPDVSGLTASMTLHVVGASGGADRRLTNLRVDGITPAWSPDGSRVAFSANGTLYVVGRDGHHLRAYPSVGTLEPTFDTLAWSPDGSKILVSMSLLAIRTVNVRTGRALTLATATSSSVVEDAVWSPDGSRIAYVDATGVKVMSAGGGAARLVSRSANASTPSWSPDGRQLMYLESAGADPMTLTHSIVIVDVTGQHRRVLIEGDYRLDFPSWAPTARHS